MTRKSHRIPQVAFSILLALSLRPRHGYEIIKQVEQDSGGEITLVSGALYTSIKKLHEQGLIEELIDKTQSRRYYKLTDVGSKALAAELAYYETTVELGRQRRILDVRAV